MKLGVGRGQFDAGVNGLIFIAGERDCGAKLSCSKTKYKSFDWDLNL